MITPTCPTCHKNTEVRPGAWAGRWVCACGASFGSVELIEFHPLFPGAECTVSPTSETSGTVGEAELDDPAAKTGKHIVGDCVFVDDSPRQGTISGEAVLNGDEFHDKLGITLLDAKYLDPSCHKGCQSLKHRNDLDASQQTVAVLRAVLGIVVRRWADSTAAASAFHEQTVAQLQEELERAQLRSVPPPQP